MVNVPTSLNNIKTNVDDLNVSKLRTVSLELTKLSDLVDNEVVKKINTLKANVNNLEKNISYTTTLIHTNQYNTDKENLEKKLDMLIKNTRCEWFSDYCCSEYKT